MRAGSVAVGLAALALAACQVPNPRYCGGARGCPPGTRCDPQSRMCVAASGGSDGGGPPPAHRPANCPSFALFCDDFEGDNFAQQWTLRSDASDDRVEVVELANAHSGTHALHLSAHDTGYGHRYLQHTVVPAVTSTLIAVRAWIYVVHKNGNYILPIAVSDSGGAALYQAGFYDHPPNSGHPLTVGVNSYASGGHYSTTYSGSVGEWRCFELGVEVPGKGEMGKVEARIDDADPPFLFREVTNPANHGYDTVQIGVTEAMNVSGPPDTELYLDDVVVAKEQIHCEPAASMP